MKFKRMLIFLFLFAIVFIYRRNKFTNSPLLHYPPAEQLDVKGNSLMNAYSVGPFTHQPSLTLYENLSRKRINNYIFIIDNKHKLQIALIDLGYTSLLNANYFSEEHTYSFDLNMKFSIPQNFNSHNLVLDSTGKTKAYVFAFNDSESYVGRSKVVVSNFDLIYSKGKSQFKLSLKHKQPSEGCVTYLRNGVVSYKCYGGTVSGSFDILIKDQNQEKTIYEASKTFQQGTSTAAFDGFRASGWEWDWVWGMGSGISNGKRISINLGAIRGIGQDVLHVDDKVIPIKGIEYMLNENSTLGDSIQFKSTSQELKLDFKITAKEHKYKDMVVLKNDMVKFEGYWSGYFIDPDTQQQYLFQSLPGLIETANSIF